MTTVRLRRSGTGPQPETESGARSRLRAFDARLLAPGSAHRLAGVRAVLAATIAARLVIGDWATLGGRPDVLFRPVGVTHLLGGVPSAGGLVAVQVVGAVAAVLAALGQLPQRFTPRPVAVVLGRCAPAALVVGWLALLILAGVHTSAGKVMHNEVVLLLATIPMLFSPSRARLGDRRRSPAYGWAPRASLLVVGAVYFITGLQKVLHSGPAWVLSDNMSWVLYQGAGAGAAPEFARWIAGLPLVPSLFAAGAVSLELLAPVILGLRRTRPLFILISAMMHGSIALFLGLDYSAWVLTVVAVALPWDSLLGASRAARPG